MLTIRSKRLPSSELVSSLTVYEQPVSIMSPSTRYAAVKYKTSPEYASRETKFRHFTDFIRLDHENSLERAWWLQSEEPHVLDPVTSSQRLRN